MSIHVVNDNDNDNDNNMGKIETDESGQNANNELPILKLITYL